MKERSLETRQAEAAPAGPAKKVKLLPGQQTVRRGDGTLCVVIDGEFIEVETDSGKDSSHEAE